MANTGLLGWWLLNEITGTTAADSSGNHLDGHLGSLSDASGLPTWIPDGPRGSRALHFGPSFDGFVEVTLPKREILEPCAVSVEAWVRSSSLGGGSYILSKGANATAYSSYALYGGRPSPGGLLFYVSTTASHGDNDSPLVAHDAIWDGKWHHVVGTFDGRIVRLYLDGNQQGAGSPVRTPSSIEYNLPTHNNFYIGMYYYGVPTTPAEPRLGFNGDISDVRIWAGVLSPDEVAARHSGVDLL